MKHLGQISDEEIMGINVPNGNPLIYELDDDLMPIQHFYLEAK
jgi:2,3-bisphosphoglycerate-dependent phosphoglycerate mutase